MWAKFLARDGAILAAALLLWRGAAANSAGTGILADFTGFVSGILLGMSAYVLHEWGHVLGGLVSGSALRWNASLGSGFMFSFDTRRNSLSQFVVMSFGGFIATAVVMATYYVWLPDTLLATRIARGAVAFLAFLGLTLEVPLLLYSVLRGGVPDAAAIPMETES